MIQILLESANTLQTNCCLHYQLSLIFLNLSLKDIKILVQVLPRNHEETFSVCCTANYFILLWIYHFVFKMQENSET